MPYDDLYYYELPTDEQEYGIEGTSNPDISRLIRGEAAWPQPRAARVKMKRNLIIADLTYRARSEGYQQRACQAIYELIQHGHPVFVATNQGVIPLPLDIETIHDLLQNNAPPMASLDELKTKYVQAGRLHRLTSTNTHVLDEHSVFECMNKQSLPRHVSLRYFKSLSEEEQDRYLEILKKATPALTLGNVDIVKLGEQDESIPKYMSNDSFQAMIAVGLTMEIHKPQNPISDELDDFFYMCASEPKLFESAESLAVYDNTHGFYKPDYDYDFRHLRSIYVQEADFVELHYNDNPFYHAKYPVLEKIEATNPTSTQNLINVINPSAKNLHTLSMTSDNLNVIDFEKLTSHPGSLPGLKHVTLSGFLIKNSSALLAAAPNIQTLNIAKSIPYNTDGRFVNLPLLKHLTELTYSNSARIIDIIESQRDREDYDGNRITAYTIHFLEGLYKNKNETLLQKGAREEFRDVINTIRRYQHSLQNEVPKDTPSKPHRLTPAKTEIASPPPTLAKHDPKDRRNMGKKELFAFKNIQHTKNQGMLIDKFSQYLTIKQSETAANLIQEIQDGMCFELSHYISAFEPAAWEDFLESARRWDGQEESLSKALEKQFSNFKNIFDTVKQSKHKRVFLGDAAIDYLTHHPDLQMIGNPWHAIHVRKIDDAQWMLYDPNHYNPNNNKSIIHIAESDLKSTLKTCMGQLLEIITTEPINLKPSINSPQQFIQAGGLLTIERTKNVDDGFIQALLDADYSFDEASDALTIETTYGITAKALCLKSDNPKIRELTQKLIAIVDSFQANKEATQTETKLIEDVSEKPAASSAPPVVETQEAPQETPNIVENAPSFLKEEEQPRLEESHHEAQTEEEAIDYEKFFTAEKPNEPETLLAYCHKTIQSEHEKQRIEVTEPYQTDILCDELREYAQNTGKPVFYIHSPAELVCSAPYIRQDKDNHGTIHKGPGGKLYEFLKKHQQNQPLLVINYDAFKTDEIPKLNALLDKDPKIDHVSLPKSCRIMGVCSKKHANFYAKADFCSRFDKNLSCSIKDDEWKTKNRVTQKTAGQKTISIELFQNPNWEAQLFGYWKLVGHQLSFQTGELHQAIKAARAANCPIEFKHAPWHQDKFQREVLAKIPHDVSIIERPDVEEAYDWNQFSNILKNPPHHQDPKHCLNPGSLHTFFPHTLIQGGESVEQPGLLASASERPLRILLTAACAEDDMARLLDAAQKQKIPLQLSTIPGFNIPADLEHKIAKIPPVIKEIRTKYDLHGDCVITTKEIDVTMTTFELGKSRIVINISECGAGELFQSTEASFKNNWFDFSQKKTDVARLLAEGKSVVLKGKLRPGLRDELTAFLNQRQHQSNPAGRLIIITEDEKNAPYVSSSWSHKTEFAADKARIMAKEGLASDEEGTFSLAQLRAKKELKTDPWVGIYETCVPTLQDSLDDLDKAKAISNAFMQRRLRDLDNILKQRKFAFITGLTGVGKSTFVETILSRQKNKTVYHAENSIEAWANDRSSKQKILFIDEANLSKRQWSEFDGLHETPPHIYFKGKRIILDKHHRVVFAGNPLSYGEGRQVPPLFDQHGNACLFTPLPIASIYHLILKPITADKAIAKPILSVYQFLANCSTTDVLITPRELQMMALLAENYASRFPDKDRQDIARYYAYHLAKAHVPSQHLDAFESLFKPATADTHEDIQSPDTYHLTASRQPLAKLFVDLLALRTYRISKASNLAQQYGGLNALTIEGESGIGKSEFAVQLLVQNGYQERDILKPRSWKQFFRDMLTLYFGIPQPEQKFFYKIPVSLSSEEKEAALLKAFDEGAIVIMDEFNSCPMKERLINALLMGRTLDNKLPKKEGFFLIGIQNPVTFEGRLMASQAQQHRFIAESLAPHTQAELFEILDKKGVDKLAAEKMIELYTKHQQDNPKPTFRNLIRCAEAHLKAKAHKLSTTNLKAPPSKISFFDTLKSSTTPTQSKTSVTEPRP